MNWLDEHIDTVICGDSLEVCPGMPAKSINLVINDPPYNIGKAEWDKIPDYINWCGEWIQEAERMLMDNGSFYLFHNDFMAMMKLVFLIGEQTEFVFKQQIVWDKWHNEIKPGNNLQGAFFKIVHNPALRNYPQMAEYILFYTFQDETGLSRIYNDRDCFGSIKKYLRAERKKAGLDGHTDQSLRALCGVSLKGGGLLAHFWGDAQWMLPTAEMYAKLQTTGYFQREYEDLRREYEDLRREYEDLRYTFNNNHDTSVWFYPVPNIEERVDHPTQKPVDLIENIILHSSKPGDVVLDMFAGSCTTAVACIRTGRHYICIEKERKYCDIGEKRIEETRREMEQERRQLDLFQEAAGD